MPWLDDETPIEVTTAFLNRNISGWPQPNTPRIDPRFRMVHGVLAPAPRPSRHLFRLRPNGIFTTPILNCWIDLLAISDTQLEGISGPHPSTGWDIKLTLTLFADPIEQPETATSGIEYRWTFSFPGEPDFFYWMMFTDEDISQPDEIKIQQTKTFVVGPSFPTDDNKDPILNAAFPAPVHGNVEFWGMSECWVFPGAAAPLGSAEFNNVDTSILFDGYTLITATAVKFELDVRLRDNNFCAVLARRFNTTRWVGLKQDFFQWRSTSVPLSPLIPLSEWGTFRAEFDWSVSGLAWKCWWNDVLIGTTAAAFQHALVFNQMGRRGATYVGDYDCRKLTLQDTDPAAPRLLLSTELQNDACDIGPSGLKGTTEGMTLPSCPP